MERRSQSEHADRDRAGVAPIRARTAPMRQGKAANTAQSAGVRRSHGEAMNAVVATKPASKHSVGSHPFCHNGQKTKNGATNNNCPLSIAPAANKQPHQNHRSFKAANAANR